MEPLKILIADDSEFMRVAYKRALESQSNLRVVAMAEDGEEAVKMTTESRPDVAILDIRMPKMDGIKVAHRILDQYPNTGIVMISAYDDLSFVADLVRYGPERKAFILKNSLFEISEFLRVVGAVINGQTVLDPAIVHQMARLYCKHSNALTSRLSEMEQDILGMMAEGYDDLYIGRNLHMDEQLVSERAQAVYDKLNIGEGSEQERRNKAIQAFVNQVHALPLPGLGTRPPQTSETLS